MPHSLSVACNEFETSIWWQRCHQCVVNLSLCRRQNKFCFREINTKTRSIDRRRPSSSSNGRQTALWCGTVWSESRLNIYWSKRSNDSLSNYRIQPLSPTGEGDPRWQCKLSHLQHIERVSFHRNNHSIDKQSWHLARDVGNLRHRAHWELIYRLSSHLRISRKE